MKLREDARVGKDVAGDGECAVACDWYQSISQHQNVTNVRSIEAVGIEEDRIGL